MLLGAASASAQNVSARVVMTTDRSEVGVGESFRLQIRADVTGADVDAFDPPPLDGFVVRGRQVSRPVQFRFFGGQQQVIQSTTIHTYTLVAEQPGRYDLEPATVRAAGQEFQSNPITIVAGGSSAPTQPPQQQPQQTPQQPNIAVDGAQVDGNAFLRTVADVADPYVGQQVTVSVYLYTRAPIRAAPQITREPTADGFWIHDLLPAQRTLDAQSQVIQGTSYRVYLLRRFAAFPLRDGELSIGAPEITLSTGSLFDMFNGSQQLERTGVPIAIRVKPLPDPVPPNAVVGTYTLEASLDRNQVRTGDAITLTAVVRGVGNVRDVRFGQLSIDGIQVLEQPAEDTVEQPNDRVGGMRRMSWLLVPQRPGTFRIPPLVLNAFDPATRRYQSVRGPDLQIIAAGNAIEPDPADVEPDEPAVDETEEEIAPPEFGPIRTHSELRRATPPLSSAPWYFALLAGLPLLTIVAGVSLRQLRRRRENPKAVPAKRRLDQAEKQAASGDARAFYGAVSATLKSAVESKIGEAVGGLTHDALRRDLRQRGMSEEFVRKLIEELEACDFARFSSAGASRDEMDRTLGRARGLLTELDRFRPQEAA